MSVGERRSMIVHAVLPLLVEHGPAVTTSQIARAAGIGEGTIFRAFKDKEELFDACTAEALRPDRVLDAIAEIPLDQPLEQRLAEAADALGAHLERMSALMAALHPLGRGRRSPMKGGRRESMNAMREAVAELFAPDQDRLRLPAGQLASLFLALLFSGKRLSLDDSPSTREIIDVFLHGALGAA
ncbi:TetR/AcrR family transcriptional regulator [Allokutzneria albata]|uniref:DNA-binding transcriptional regulator, AcrR family n=1 Tax=Allokutzneria albata TaxID=211114 RepID=A0A1H0B2F5_ALLAB|nr:TetR/AcrR family transcriptional regulator [Allokutzneria albata]SDN39765.1 DNA-binding transcriptional regulator, AcrR family [Allokutzneria albata]